MRKILKYKEALFLGLIFILALTVRFWWFPSNVYFGYDQARDAFISQEIYLKRDLKIIGPSAGKEGLHHGPLYWYLIGPVYLLFRGNPAAVLALISIFNALGIFLVFYFGKELFNEKAGFFSALLYSFFFSQTQYSLYFANPAPAVLTIMLFFLGWALLLLKNIPWAWVLIGLGLGLSIQFEFFLIYLASSAILFFLIFYKQIKKYFNFKFFVFGTLSFIASMFTFVLAELKYNFRTTRTIFSILTSFGASSGEKVATSVFLGRLGEEIRFGFLGLHPRHNNYLAISFISLLVYFFLRGKRDKKALSIISIWIVSNLFVDFFGSPQLYYVNIGVSVSIILFAGYLLSKVWKYKKILAVLAILFLAVNNLAFAKNYNPRGPINTLYVQEGMLLKDEKKVIDHIYQDAQGKEFAVNALTMPLNIKTTWAYLFNWYGMNEYGYVPHWGGENVPGYPGSLPEKKSHNLVRYTIFEPTRGIPEHLKKDFIASENGYGEPLFEKNIGDFVLQKRLSLY